MSGGKGSGGSGGEFSELNTDSDTTLQQLELYQLRHDRLERNKAIMQVLSGFVLGKGRVEGGGEFPKLNTDSDITLLQLELYQLRHDRLGETRLSCRYCLVCLRQGEG